MRLVDRRAKRGRGGERIVPTCAVARLYNLKGNVNMSPGKEICSFLKCSTVFQLEVLGEKLDLSDWLLLMQI